MKLFRKPIRALTLLLAAVFLAAMGIGLEYGFSHRSASQIDTGKFEEEFFGKTEKTLVWLDKAGKELEDHGLKQFLHNAFVEWPAVLEKENSALLLFEGNKLRFWSDNSLWRENDSITFAPGKYVVFLNHAWWYCISRNQGDYRWVGCVKIKTEYPVDNRFTDNAFVPGFDVPPGTGISLLPVLNGFEVRDKGGNFLFDLVPSGPSLAETKSWAPGLAYSLAIVMLLLAAARWVRVLPAPGKRNAFLFLLLIMVPVRGVMMYYGIPHVFYTSPLFGPDLYASSQFLPSLGDLLLDVVLFFFLTFLVYRELDVSPGNNTSGKSKIFRGVLILLPVVIVSGLSLYLSRSLILHSSISFGIYNILDLDIYSVIAVLAICLQILVVAFLMDKTVLILRRTWKFVHVIALFTFLESLGCVFMVVGTGWNEWSSLLFFILLFAVLGDLRFTRRRLMGFSHYIIILFVTAAYFTIFILHFYQEKERSVRQVIAENLSSERDLVAELLLEDFQKKIAEDRIIADLVSRPVVDHFEVYRYLRENYFSGFWTKYDLQTTVCRSIDNLSFKQTGEVYNCFDYFAEVADTKGIMIPNTNFWFVDNDNGRISYLGIIPFRGDRKDSSITRMFIELDSRLLSQQLGYPELMLDRRVGESQAASGVSSARYRNGRLVAKSGDFAYNLTSASYHIPDAQFNIIHADGFEHLFYRPDAKNLIAVSVPETTFYDSLIAFSYSFVFFFILFMAFYAWRNLKLNVRLPGLNIRNRIQLSFVLILVVSFLFIGGGTVYYIYKAYEKKNLETISEKMQSVIVELENRIGNEQSLTPEMSNYINSLLVNFSNVFYSDINLFTPQGELYGTSRPEIFSRGFAGSLMDPAAYFELNYHKKPEVIRKEQIGRLEYLSAYTPFLNNNGKLIAYLNLPYFTRANVLTREISTFVIALINIYLILILLTISVTVVISNGLTRPLVQLQRKFREIDFGKKNEPIRYNRADEIGALVKEYNRMLEELALSADMLARSERESAWREMAKQIAHEIKNPLTPMKLSVQYLQRQMAERAPGWEKLVDKVSKTIIDQIDTLSAIASEFSTFARMPAPVIEEVELIEKMEGIASLYRQESGMDIRVETHGNEKIFVKADKEQILRILNNLVKNAVQAIPPDRAGHILIEANLYPSVVVLKVTDNGSGIPMELHDKMFTPNFTTKSSGMGLGLTMVKNMAESMGGSIRFVTSQEKGTTFIIEIPAHE